VGNRLSKLSRVEQDFLESGDALTALAERTAEVDQCVLRAASELLFPGASGAPALLAVGGYGRRQLFPYSDVDLLLLFPSERAAEERKEAISAFLQKLWDSGLRVSQSVRTPAECTEVHDDNSELNISLLDQRYLAGDRTLYAGMAEKLPRFLSASRESLIRNLAKLSRDRYSKFGNTFYHLEPNVKETPGGLRDFQLICWLEQLREGSYDPPAELKMAFRFMARLRCYLHCLYARDANVLSFEAQDAISEQWQHADAALWMRDYYRHARTIYRTAGRELENNEAQASSLFSQFRAGTGTAAVRIRGAAWHPAVVRSGTADRSAAGEAAGAVGGESGNGADAAQHILATIRSAGGAMHERKRRHGGDLSGTESDRVPGDPRFLPPLYSR
jgi:[protein-PII] uridylyltransferase